MVKVKNEKKRKENKKNSIGKGGGPLPFDETKPVSLLLVSRFNDSSFVAPTHLFSLIITSIIIISSFKFSTPRTHSLLLFPHTSLFFLSSLFFQEQGLVCWILYLIVLDLYKHVSLYVMQT